MRSILSALTICIVATLAPAASAKELKVKNGGTVDVKEVGVVNAKDGKFVALRYATNVDFSNSKAVADEVAEVWKLFRLNVYGSGLSKALIRVTDKPADPKQAKRTDFIFTPDAAGVWKCSVPAVSLGTVEENLVAQSMALMSKQKLDEALQKATAATQANPKYWQAYRALGAVYVRQKNYPKCAEAYAQVVKLAPDSSEAFGNKGAVEITMKDYKAAVADLSQAIKLNKNNFEAYITRAAAYKLLKDPQNALKDCDAAIAINPKAARAYINKAGVDLAMNNLEAAKADATKAIELNPRIAAAYSNRGVALFKLGVYPDAQKDLDKSTTLPNTFPEAYYYLGRTYEKLGNQKLAELNLGKAKKLGYVF